MTEEELISWELDANQFERLCFGWNKDGAGPYNVDYETAQEINERVISLISEVRKQREELRIITGLCPLGPKELRQAADEIEKMKFYDSSIYGVLAIEQKDLEDVIIAILAIVIMFKWISK